MMKGARSTTIAPCHARLTRADLDAGIELGGRYMLAAQRPDGKFDYEVDWTTGWESSDDNAVRQAGAAWGMALLYRETRRPDYRIAIDHVLTRQDGRSGQLGAACLIGLSFLERLAFPDGLTDPAAFRTTLDALCAIAEDARLPSGGFHGKFDVRTSTFSGRPDPYSSGEALLLLARSGLELGIPERVAKAIAWAEQDYDLFVTKPLAKEPDPDITKGYYQWSSMTWFALASAGYAPRKWGERLVKQALWMVDVHRTLSRPRNTGYAYEGIIPAWEWARRNGDHDTARKLACVIHQGLRKLCSWQLGHPLAPAALRAAPERFHGAVQNHASEPALRIDVTQHQLHALMYARQFGVDTAKHLCEAPPSGEAKPQPGPTGITKASAPSNRNSANPKPQAATHSLFEFTVTHVYRGPNIHAPKAAVRCEVVVTNLELLDSTTLALGIQSLKRLLPELDMTPLTELKDSRWIKKATSNKIQLAETAAMVTFALMRRADEWIAPVISGFLENNSGFYLICEYRRSIDNAKLAAALALDLIALACQSPDDETKLSQALTDFEHKGRWRNKVYAAFLVEEAELQGVPISLSVAGPPMLGWGNSQKRLRETDTSLTSHLGASMSGDKVETADVLKQIGLPAPRQFTVRSKNEALAAAKRVGYPVVVKPIDGNKGNGVSVKLTSETAIEKAYEEAAAISKRVVVESFIEGSDYRLLVVDGELVAASQRIPGRVVGNGKDSIGQLLEKLNSDPRRDGRSLHKLEFDFDAQRMLEEQGLTLGSVPTDGQVVALRSKANLSSGGTSVWCTERVHPDNRLLAVAAARALQLDVAGIDLITTDISRSYKETKGAICEANTCPLITGLHRDPVSGSGDLIAPYILDMLFPSSTGRIPIIAVLRGNSSRDRLSHSIAHLLQISGHEVGLAAYEGLWIGGDRILESDSANFEGAKKVLLHPCVTAAVIEVSAESLLRDGLGFDFADAAVITDDFTTQIGGNEDVAALICSSAGALIVDGDARELLSAVGQNKLYLTDHSCIDPSHENVVRIVQDGETAVTLEASDRRSIALPPIGNSARQIALCVAACDAIGIAPGMIEDALRVNIDTNECDLLLIRGLSTPHGRVLMATPRNGEEVEAICRMAQSWAAPQSPGIVIHMTFEGDPGLRAALDAQLRTGAARVLATDPTNHDLPALVFKNSNGRVVIMTDRMEYIRRRLED